MMTEPGAHGAVARAAPMSDMDRDNQLERQQHQAARQGFAREARAAARQYLGQPPPGCPVCGGPTGPDFTAQHEGRVYEFCSEACRVAFEAEPRAYL
jgi:YHS domain-containing protein